MGYEGTILFERYVERENIGKIKEKQLQIYDFVP